MSKTVFRIVYLNNGKLYELYAERVAYASEMFGFVEVQGLLFGERSALVVDPSEERLKAEFAGVRRFLVPVHAVVRIDEVDKQGHSKITDASGGNNVTPFPLYTPGGPARS